MFFQHSGPNEEEERINQLFDEQFGPLTRAVVLMIDDVDEAEEIVQEAFARLLTSRRRMRDLDNAPAYMRSIAFNLARSKLRRRKTQRANQSFVEQQSVAVEASQLTPEALAMVSADEKAVVAALGDLPTRQRECLVLRYYMSLSEKEVAQTLNISKGSVKTHTSRGLAALHEVLGAQR